MSKKKDKMIKCTRCEKENSDFRWNFRTIGFLKKLGLKAKFTPILKGLESGKKLSYICPSCGKKVSADELNGNIAKDQFSVG